MYPKYYRNFKTKELVVLKNHREYSDFTYRKYFEIGWEVISEKEYDDYRLIQRLETAC